MSFYESQPKIVPLHQLLDQVLSGALRIPRFQRPGTETTWRPEQRRDLLDSVYRGIPIGTILVWSTQEPINTLPAIGGADIPDFDSKESRKLLVLDGHQRLSTLVATLGPGLDLYKQRNRIGAPSPRERWVFDIDGDDTRADTRFKLLDPGKSPGPKDVPLSIALNRKQLNQWVRDRGELTEKEVQRVDSLRDRFREYNMPVATLATESLEEATETFKRVNSSGTPMSDFHMVAALAYTHEFDPQSGFADARTEYLEPLGWGEVEDLDLLRVCAGLLRDEDKSLHPSKLNVAKLAKQLRQQPALIERAGQSMALAAKLLSEQAGIHGPEILPYSWQLIVLAIHLGSRNPPDAPLTARQKSQATRWFWLTTYGSVFAGVNSTIVDWSQKALQDMVAGKDERAMKPYIGSRVEEPGDFDRRAARSRACLLSMARVSDGSNLHGPAHKALAAGMRSIGVLSNNHPRGSWYNRCIADPDDQTRLREALRHHGQGKATLEDTALLKKHCIEPKDKGTIDELLQTRRERLVKSEKKFVDGLGLNWEPQVTPSS